LILHSVGPGSGALAAPEISRGIARTGRRVEVILEPGTRRFVGPAAFEASTVEEPTQTPEAILFAPATAATLARLAHGLDGVLADRVFVAPDLDSATARHPAVEENLALLGEDGYRVVAGRGGSMAPAGEVVAAVLHGLDGPMSGLKVLVTAGGTREPVDSVRFIGNRSSGKMGLAVAREAARLGAEVSVVAANVEGVEPETEWVAVETVEELRAEVLRRAGGADALVMAAAVSDFKPVSPVEAKIRRTEGGLSLELEPTADILKAVRGRYPDLFVVGFAATHGDPVPDAREKLGSKGVNLVVGNDISREGIGFGADENEVYVVGRGGVRFVPRASKEDVARVILESLLEEMSKERQV
jgi:phosphopantothenoylcysteine decarboxylase / phosphopantothenate---cysteine ligase